MRLIAITTLTLALSGFGYAAEAAPSPIAPAELQVFLPVVLPALKPDEQAALSKEMQTASTLEALAAVVTKYAITVQGRGAKLPHPVAVGPVTQTVAPASTAVAEIPGARPITADEVRDFSNIIGQELFKIGQTEVYIEEAQKARTLEGQLAVMNKYAAKLQARGVKFPHPVLADGSVPPLPGGLSEVHDPEARVPTTLDPAWTVKLYDGEGKDVSNITKHVGRRIIRTYYDVAGFREREESFPDNGNPDNGSSDPKDWYLERSWTQNQRLRSLTIGGLTYGLPAAVHPGHPRYNDKQVIVWNDPTDQNKGIRSATSLPATEPEGSTAYIGTWIAWDNRGRETEHGQMLGGVRTGTWTERTFDAKAGADPITEATGTYINGKRSGTWTIKLSGTHPDAVKASEEAQKHGQVSTGSVNGFVIEQIYESGTVVKETRSF